jgi:microcystin-dependent protein
MAQPYVGEIRLFAGSFAPLGWAFCNGELIAISENETLFQLIGTTYGGDGQTNFALPDLRGRVPLHQGNSFIVGQAAGVESVTLTVQQIPAHTHPLLAAQVSGNEVNPGGNMLAETSGGLRPYIEDSPTSPMASQSVAPIGGSQPHDNFQPYLCVSFIISLFGIFPSPT